MSAIQALQKELMEVKKMFNALKVAVEKEETTLKITISKDGKEVHLGELGNTDIQIHCEIIEESLDDGFGIKKLKAITDRLNETADEPIWHINTMPDDDDMSAYWELYDIPDGVISLIKGKTLKVKAHLSNISITFS